MGSGKERPGVRGPRGPQGSSASGAPRAASSGPPPMNAFQRVSLPVLTFLSGLPRWLLVVALAGLLVLGVIQTGPLAWLGALILLLLALFFLWLLVLSWPALPATGRILRGVVVLALLAGAYLKIIGRL